MQVLVDVGAGYGYFSLAAAARGHQAIAFEMSNLSVASFEASIAYNGFKKAIALHKASFSCIPALPGLWASALGLSSGPSYDFISR